MKNTSSLFEYRLPGVEEVLCPGNTYWDMPLAGTGAAGQCPGTPVKTDDSRGPSVGYYLLSAQHFLEKRNLSVLHRGIEHVFPSDHGYLRIVKITLSLEKHGPFYHPLKITTWLSNGKSAFFVLNGAVSAAGLSVIEKEYNTIDRLNKTRSESFLPKVFGQGTVCVSKHETAFFLGSWFVGFDEFHAVNTASGIRTALLKDDGKFEPVTEKSAFCIYRKASEILTLYYDFDSFEQIFPWHHAAGDFVADCTESTPRVRLITVRNYEAMFADADGEKADETDMPQRETVHIALLLFFLNLTLRMRMDRLRGTGTYVFLGEKVAEASVVGFLNALYRKRAAPAFYKEFVRFIKLFDAKNFLEIFPGIIAACRSSKPEISLIEDNIESHCHILHKTLKNF